MFRQEWAKNETAQTHFTLEHIFYTFTSVQALVFENPNFEGECLELDSDVYNLLEQEERGTAVKKTTLSTVGSMKILGGL